MMPAIRVAAALVATWVAIASPSVLAAGSPSHRLRNTTVAYAEGKDVTMRVYRPTGAAPENGRPAVLFVHGGAWERPDARASEYTFARGLAKDLGWVVAIPNYPTSIKKYRQTEPKEIHEAFVALRHQPGVDLQRVAMWGESAGGNLALLEAYRHPTQSAAVVSISGPTDMTAAYGEQIQTVLGAIKRYEGTDPGTAADNGSDRYRSTSPDDVATAAAPPTFQAGSQDDPLVPAKQLRLLRHRLRARHVANRLAIVPGTAHVPEDEAIPGTRKVVAQAAIIFLEHHGLPAVR